MDIYTLKNNNLKMWTLIGSKPCFYNSKENLRFNKKRVNSTFQFSAGYIIKEITKGFPCSHTLYRL